MIDNIASNPWAFWILWITIMGTSMWALAGMLLGWWPWNRHG